MPTRPPKPPVTGLASVNTVTASICSPRLAMTKYSSRTRSAGSARQSDSSPAAAAPAAAAASRSGVTFSESCAAA